MIKPEDKYRNNIDKFLIKDFEIDREVWSNCRTKRIDYILKCKRSGHLFGLEVKKKEHLTGVKLGEYLIQASNYSKLEFKTKLELNPKKVLIFISPAISNVIREIKPESSIIKDNKYFYELYHNLDAKTDNTNSLIGCFNVGEVKSHKARNKIYSYYYFVYKNQIIWDSLNGIREYNYNNIYRVMIKNSID